MSQRRVIIDPAKTKAVQDILGKETLPEKPVVKSPLPVVSDVSIDDLLNRALRAIYGLMRAIEAEITTGTHTRDTVMNLKDVSNLLWEFKKKEHEFLEKLTDEQLDKL